MYGVDRRVVGFTQKERKKKKKRVKPFKRSMERSVALDAHDLSHSHNHAAVWRSNTGRSRRKVKERQDEVAPATSSLSEREKTKTAPLSFHSVPLLLLFFFFFLLSQKRRKSYISRRLTSALRRESANLLCWISSLWMSSEEAPLCSRLWRLSRTRKRSYRFQITTAWQQSRQHWRAPIV